MTVWKTWFLHHPTLNKLYLPTSVKRILILLCKPFIPLSWLHPCPKDHCLNELNFFFIFMYMKAFLQALVFDTVVLEKKNFETSRFLNYLSFFWKCENLHQIYTQKQMPDKNLIRKAHLSRYIRISPSMLNVLAPCQLKKPNYI